MRPPNDPRPATRIAATDRAGDPAGRGLVVVFAALGLGQAAAYGLLAAWEGYHAQPILAILVALAAFVLYLPALAIARRLSKARMGTALAVAVISGLVFRALLLPEPPFLSDDHYRYLWDGLVAARGIDPYAYAPADPALTSIDDALRARVNHPHVPTVYGPLAQLVFLLAAVTSSGWLGLKAVWLICDVAIAAILFRLVAVPRRLHALTLYWWSPLVMVEVAWNAHLDLLGVFPMLLAIAIAVPIAPTIGTQAASSRRRSAALGIAVAGSALVKYFPAALLAAAGRRARALPVSVAFTVAALALYLPHLDTGAGVFQGLLTFAERWRFNAGLFQVLAWTTGSTPAAKAIAAAIVLAIVLQSARNAWSLERAAFWIVGAILMFAPTLHPWYLLWMVPLIALRPNPGWLYLTGSVFLAYYGLGAYRAEGVWPEPFWVKILIYGPFLVLLARHAWRGSWLRTAWEVVSARGS